MEATGVPTVKRALRGLTKKKRMVDRGLSKRVFEFCFGGIKAIACLVVFCLSPKFIT